MIPEQKTSLLSVCPKARSNKATFETAIETVSLAEPKGLAAFAPTPTAIAVEKAKQFIPTESTLLLTGPNYAIIP